MGRPSSPRNVPLDSKPGLAMRTVEVVVEQIPTPPDTLGEDGRRFHAEAWASASWLQPRADRWLVESAAQLVDDMADARAEIARSGRYHTLPNGIQSRSPAAVDLERLAITLNALLASLGLSPADRARLGIATLESESVLMKLERRRADRRAESWADERSRLVARIAELEALTAPEPKSVTTYSGGEAG
jgi:P27 family predicted phage terminase small subunit